MPDVVTPRATPIPFQAPVSLRAAVGIAVLSIVLAGCGSDGGSSSDTPPTTAAPFTIDPERAYGVWPETTFDQSLAAAADAGRWRTAAQGTAERLLEEVLGWDDGALVDIERVADSDQNEEKYRYESAAVGAEATVITLPVPDTSIWVVTSWQVISGSEPSLGISVGNGDDGVSYGSGVGAETADFAIRYGSQAVEELDVDLTSGDQWDPMLEQPLDTPGMVSVVVRDGLGAVVEGVAARLPAGPFAAG